MKNKATTIIILVITFILAGVAIFTAVRLYQLRQTSISPAAPSSRPAAAGTTCGGIAGTICPSNEVCIYSNGTTRAPSIDASGTCQPISSAKASEVCTLSFSLTSTTSTPTPTGSTTTPTATSTSTPTVSGTATPTGTPTTTSTPTGGTSTPGATQPSLPNSGSSWPTIVGAGLGIFVILGSLLLAL